VILIHRGDANLAGDQDVGLSSGVPHFVNALARGELLELDLSREHGGLLIVEKGE
jgi:hypothetical protein